MAEWSRTARFPAESRDVKREDVVDELIIPSSASVFLSIDRIERQRRRNEEDKDKNRSCSRLRFSKVCDGAVSRSNGAQRLSRLL